MAGSLDSATKDSRAMPALFRSLLVGLLLFPLAAIGQETLRSKAVVSYTFDEADGNALDTATAGQGPNEGRLVQNPVRVASPFWNQSGKKSLQLDAARQQYVEIADAPDVDAATAVSISLFVVNLTDPADNAFHGLFAKRGIEDGRASTNYGINFQMQADNLQVYIHDGTNYKVVNFSVKDALPSRKLVHLTTTFEVLDATKQDDDTDADDVRVQLFVNGEPLSPKAAPNGYIEGKTGWIRDVQVPGLLNNLPVTLGRSEVAGEYLSCVLDEFLMLPMALKPAEAKSLFLEVAGANVAELMAQDKAVPAVVPVITSLSQTGLQSGQATQLVVNGSDLGPQPAAVFPLPGVTFDVAAESTPTRLVLSVNVPADSPCGIFPLWIRSQSGISKSVALAIDRLPHMAAASSTPAAPSTLPAAFVGSLAGGQQQRIYFQGVKGQRVVADVELKRLGSAASPVLEIKSPAGTPLQIGWGQASLRGDARVEAILPKDGLYSVELHDLAYRAPGQNPFRLKVGDLKLVDGVLPAAVAPGTVEVQPIGSGFTTGARVTAQVATAPESRTGLLQIPAESGIAAALPGVRLSSGIEIVEAPVTDGAVQTIDATFASRQPVGISGVIATKGERDRYLLQVTPQSTLHFTLQTELIGSPLEGALTLRSHPEGNVLAMSGEQPAVGDLNLNYKVPAEVNQIQVDVRDLFGRGSARSFYRLVLEPANQPTFSLMLNTPTINLPEDGSAMVELQVTRAGYAGPIRLSVVGDTSVVVSPQEIAGNMQGKVLLRLVRSGPPAADSRSLLRLVGESTGVEPALRQTAVLQTGVIAPTFTDTMAVGTTASSGLTIEIEQLPGVLFRGDSPQLNVVIKRVPGHPSATLPIRLTLESTEPIRRKDNNNPAAGTIPAVSAESTIVGPESRQSPFRLTVPLEVSEPVIDFVVKAVAVPHAYSERVLATAYSQPFRAEIKTAITPKVDAASLRITGEQDAKVTGELQRTPGFAGPVEVTLVGLPAGYTAQAVTVAGDQNRFEIPVKGPAVAAETAVPNVKLRLTTQGSLLVAEMPVSLTVVPKP